MIKIIAYLAVFVATFGGFMLGGGTVEIITGVVLHALPGEGLTIVGIAICAFVIANSPHTIKTTLGYLKKITKPEAHSKQDYLELLSVLFSIFKLARTKGWLALENHIEKPEDSELFKSFPGFFNNHHAVTFLTDYLRIISLGNENAHELEALMDEELETLHHEKMHAGHAVQQMADGIPALGIVAAVLGVIKTMASITEPPEVLGFLIGGALVGTFLGVWIAYSFVGPTASAMTSRAESEMKYYKTMKTTILAYLQGAAPQVAVEFGRKTLHHEVQPSFLEVEETVNALPSFAK